MKICNIKYVTLKLLQINMCDLSIQWFKGAVKYPCMLMVTSEKHFSRSGERKRAEKTIWTICILVLCLQMAKRDLRDAVSFHSLLQIAEHL